MLKVCIFITALISNICFAVPPGYVNAQERANIDYRSCRKDFALKLCKVHPDVYQCIKIHKNAQLYVTWEEAFKDEGIRTLVQKINRRNSLIWRNHCIAVPYGMNEHMNELDYAPFLKKISIVPAGHYKTIFVDLNQLAWGAYDGENLVAWGPANGGAGKCKETGKYTCKTPVGFWRIIEKKGPFSRSTLYPVECKDKNICGHPVFYLMKFHSSGTSIHGDKNLPGVNISHGCVRVLRKDAKWLSQNFAEVGTEVIVDSY